MRLNKYSKIKKSTVSASPAPSQGGSSSSASGRELQRTLWGIPDYGQDIVEDISADINIRAGKSLSSPSVTAEKELFAWSPEDNAFIDIGANVGQMRRRITELTQTVHTLLERVTLLQDKVDALSNP